MARDSCRFSIPTAALVLAACLHVQTAMAEEFLPVHSAAEQLQTRRYEVDDAEILLHAILAVLQDIRYLVTKSEVAPGLLVARAPWRSCRCNSSLTISVQEVAGRAGSFQARLTASTVTATETGMRLFRKTRRPDKTDFYQDFFTHLDRELFKERRR